MKDTTNNDQPLHTVGAIRDLPEGKPANAALSASETRYRRLFEAAHDGILILDPDTCKIIDANPFMTQLLGYSQDELIGMEFYEIGFLADAQASQEMFQTLKTTRKVRYENLPLQTRQGELRDVEVVANLYDESGHTVVQCNVRDITDRRRAETEMAERRKFIDGIFKVLPGVLYVFDMDENRVVFVNNTGALTFSPEEVADMGADVVRNLMHPDDQQRFQQHIARMRTLNSDETATFEYRMRDRADEWRWYMGTDAVYLRNESGVALQIIGVAPEITERKRTEAAQRESEARHSFLIGSWAQAVWETDAHGVVIADSPSWRAYTGQTLQEWLGYGWLDAIHPDDRVFAERQWREATAARGLVNAEFRLCGPDGGWRWTNVRAAPVLDEKGDIEKWAGMNIDIEAHKRAETALRKSEEQQAYLLKLSDAIRMFGDPLDVLTAALRVLGEHFGVNRAFYDEVDEQLDTYVFHRTYANGVASLTGSFRLSEIPLTAELAGSGQIVVIDDASADPRLSAVERAAYAGMEAAAFLGVPLVKDGRLVSTLGVHHATPRQWTPEDIALIRETAERTWAAVARARAEAALRAAHDTFRHLVDRSPFGIYAIDADFRLVQISDGAQKAFETVQPAIGRDLAEMLRILWPDPFASEAIARFRHTLATGEPFGEEMSDIRADLAVGESYDWKLERITMPDGRFGVVCNFYDLSERKRHEDHAQLLMAEVNHRAKNLLSVVQAVAQQTASSGDPLTFAARLSDRISGLAANQDLLVKNLWHGVEVDELVTSQLAHFKDLIDTRIHLNGPGLMVTAAASQAIGMALHELATNAAKYGALSNSNGQVHVEWQLSAGPDSLFQMSWRESDGPQVKAPTRKGFGQTVIKRLVEFSVEGSVKVDYAEDGFSWHLGTAARNVLVISGGGVNEPE